LFELVRALASMVAAKVTLNPHTQNRRMRQPKSIHEPVGRPSLKENSKTAPFAKCAKSAAPGARAHHRKVVQYSRECRLRRRRRREACVECTRVEPPGSIIHRFAAVPKYLRVSFLPQVPSTSVSTKILTTSLSLSVTIRTAESSMGCILPAHRSITPI
jgi:hypothetical protein